MNNIVDKKNMVIEDFYRSEEFKEFEKSFNVFINALSKCVIVLASALMENKKENNVVEVINNE